MNSLIWLESVTSALCLFFSLPLRLWRPRAPLTLPEAVKQALDKNPEIQTAPASAARHGAKAKQAPYLEDPQIALQLNGVPLSNPTSFNQADTNSIGIRQMVPFFGKLGLKEKIAQREVNIVEQELRAKEREIIAMVKMAYADLFMARKIRRNSSRAAGDRAYYYRRYRSALSGRQSAATGCFQGASWSKARF